MKKHEATYHLDMTNNIDCNKAVDTYPLNLCKTNEKFKAKKEVYKKLIPQDPYVLFFAPEQIKDDEEIGLLALEEPWTIRYMSRRLKSLDTIVHKAYKKGRSQFLDFEMDLLNIESNRDIQPTQFQKEILARCVDNQLYTGMEDYEEMSSQVDSVEKPELLKRDL